MARKRVFPKGTSRRHTDLDISVVQDPRPGDTCAHIHPFGGHASWTTYVKERPAYNLVHVLHVNGPRRTEIVISLEEWRAQCMWGYRKEDRRDGVRERNRRQGFRRTLRGNGTYFEPPPYIPPKVDHGPTEYTGPTCGATSECETPYTKKRGLPPVQLTCHKAPHDDDAHWDKKEFVGWGKEPRWNNMWMVK